MSAAPSSPVPTGVARVLTCLAVAYLAAALVLNEWVLGAAFGDGSIEPGTRIGLRLADAVLLGLGLLAILGRRNLVIAQLQLAAFAILASIASVEISLRVLEIEPSFLLAEEYRLRQMDDQLHHVLAPNLSATIRWGDRLTTYHTNSLGFRDFAVREIEPDARDRWRVLILGDSFAEGIGVEYRDGFAFRLQRLLEDSAIPAEVLSAGMVSYSPSLESRQLRKFFGAGYTTDVVILMLDVSDVYDEGHDYRDWNGFGDADRRSNAIERAEKMRAALEKEADLDHRLYPRLLGRRPRAPNPSAPRYMRGARAQWTERSETRQKRWVADGIARCSAFIREIAAQCRKREISFFLAIYPHPTQLIGAQCTDSVYRKVFADLARSRSIALIDLFPVFCNLPDWQAYFIPRDIHWNERGHTLAAEVLFSRLRRAREVHLSPSGISTSSRPPSRPSR